MHCSISDNYVGNESSTRLAYLQRVALEDILASFNLPATYGVTDDQLFEVRYRLEIQDPQALLLHDVSRGEPYRLYFLEAPQRVWVVKHLNWIYPDNRHLTGPPNRRGAYLYNSAAILLHEKLWCRQTMIHETLHSISLFSRIWNKFPDSRWWRLQTSLREGITECLTGYILQKSHTDCYNGWRTNQLDRCSISYTGSARLWCSLCQCVGIKDLAEFYLSSQDNLAAPWNQFIQSIQAKNFKSFEYQLNEGKAFNETSFREVCVSLIPAFREIYESLTRCLDFSRIP